MRKSIYVLLAALLSVATISCSKDDNGGDGGEPDDLLNITYQMPSTVEVYSAFTDVTSQYTYTMTSGKITKIHFESDGGEEADYTVAFTSGNCKVTYTDGGGQPYEYNYVLDAKGFAKSATAKYLAFAGEPELEFKSMTFQYSDKGMLTSITDTDEHIGVVYRAEYKSRTLVSNSGSNGAMKFSDSKIVNNCTIDPTYLYAFNYGSAIIDIQSLAALCGLLPHPNYLPATILSEMDTDGDDVDELITISVDNAQAAGKLSAQTLSAAIGGSDMDIFTLGFSY